MASKWKPWIGNPNARAQLSKRIWCRWMQAGSHSLAQTCKLVESESSLRERGLQKQPWPHRTWGLCLRKPGVPIRHIYPQTKTKAGNLRLPNAEPESESPQHKPEKRWDVPLLLVIRCGSRQTSPSIPQQQGPAGSRLESQALWPHTDLLSQYCILRRSRTLEK